MNLPPQRAGPSNSISGIVGSLVEQLDFFKGCERLVHRDIEASKIVRTGSPLPTGSDSIGLCGRAPPHYSMLKTYGPPRLQGVLSRSAADQSASTYPASEVSSRPRWRYARPGPHKTPWRRAPLSTPGFLSAV